MSAAYHLWKHVIPRRSRLTLSLNLVRDIMYICYGKMNIRLRHIRCRTLRCTHALCRSFLFPSNTDIVIIFLTVYSCASDLLAGLRRCSSTLHTTRCFCLTGSRTGPPSGCSFGLLAPNRAVPWALGGPCPTHSVFPSPPFVLLTSLSPCAYPAMNKSPSESMEEQENIDLRPPSPSSDPRISRERGWRDGSSDGDEYALHTAHESSRQSDTPWRAHVLPKRQKKRRWTRRPPDSSVAQPMKATVPSQPEVEVVRFAKLDTNADTHVDFLPLARPARTLPGGTDDGMTHEVFVVITTHCDDDKQGDKRGLWSNILRFAVRLGVN